LSSLFCNSIGVISTAEGAAVVANAVCGIIRAAIEDMVTAKVIVTNEYIFFIVI